MLSKKTPPAPTFTIPKFVAPSVSNSALEVLTVNAVENTFTAKVYDPLGISDLDHGSLITLSLDAELIPVELAPVLFRAA